jgi:YD repeat-containing protein
MLYIILDLKDFLICILFLPLNFLYNNVLQVCHGISPNGLTTTWEYDALGRQAKETRADGTTTTTNYEWWTVLENRKDACLILPRSS